MATVVVREHLEHELRLKIAGDHDVRAQSEDFAEEVRRRWVAIWESMGPHPYETGDYATSIEVRRGIAQRVQGARGSFTGEVIYRYWVGTDNEHAGFIEYGTGWDAPGTHSPWGPFTDTPEFAPAAETAAYYHGTMD